MWSSDRRKLIFSALGFSALSACGFTPLYGEGSAASAIRGQINVPVLTGGFGFTLRERLINRIGPPQDPRYRLAITFDITEEERAIRADRTITRFNLTATARFELTPLAGGNPVARGTVEAFTAYSAVASPFATRTAEEDARRRLATTLADQIAQRLAISASEWPT